MKTEEGLRGRQAALANPHNISPQKAVRHYQRRPTPEVHSTVLCVVRAKSIRLFCRYKTRGTWIFPKKTEVSPSLSSLSVREEFINVPSPVPAHPSCP